MTELKKNVHVRATKKEIIEKLKDLLWNEGYNHVFYYTTSTIYDSAGYVIGDVTIAAYPMKNNIKLIVDKSDFPKGHKWEAKYELENFSDFLKEEIGGIQGLSLNSVIKRIERIEIDNSDGLIKTQINSLYYFDKTAQEDDLLNTLISEFNKGINRILLKAEREQYYNAFLNRIEDAGLKARLKEYTQNGRFFWHDKIDSEYTLMQVLNSYKKEKKPKAYDLNKIAELMLLNGHEPTEADANKHGFLKTDYSLIEGRIKLLEGSTKELYGEIGFFPKGLKRRFKPIRKGYMFLEVD